MSNPSELVPVFNCVVDVVPPDADGTIVARVANLPEIAATGKSEREALAAAVTRFKAEVRRLHAAGEPIPWVVEQPPANGTARRLIAVHL